MHFSKKSGRLSSPGPEILAFGSHSSANFQPILDCFIPKFKLKCDDSENIKTDCVNMVVFKIHQIKEEIFLGHHPIGHAVLLTLGMTSDGLLYSCNVIYI